MRILPQLIPRAALMRLRSLDLGGINDYYVSSAAESSSTLDASAPESTNMYVMAYGDKEGLATGERLEVYGTTVRLIRTMAYGCPRGITAESVLLGAIPEHDLQVITKQLDRVAGIYDELNLHGIRHTSGGSGSSSAGGGTKETLSQRQHKGNGGATAAAMASAAPPSSSSSSSRDGSSTVWEIIRRAGQEPLPTTTTTTATQPKPAATAHASAPVAAAAPAAAAAQPATVPVTTAAASTFTEPPQLPKLSDEELAKHLRQLRHSNVEVIAAEWRRREKPPTLIAPTRGEDENDLLVENGVCFSSPEQAGLRVLRAARLAYMSMIERKANALREAQLRKRGGGEDPQPLAVLDVSEIDFSFSHAAVQTTVELGLHDEAQCRIHFIPLNDSTAQKAGGAMATFVRQVVRVPGVAHDDPFALLDLRNFDVAAYTAYLDLPPPPPKSGSDTDPQTGNASTGLAHPPPSSKRHHDASLQLARALASLRAGASLLISFVPTPRSAAAIYAAVCHGRRAEVAMEIAAVAEAKACVAAAISRCGRWGYITDEVLPMVDCPQGSAVSLIVTVL